MLALDVVFDRVDVLTLATANLVVGTVALGEQPVHLDLVRGRARVGDGRYEVAIILPLDSRQSRDFQTALLPLLGARVDPVGDLIASVPHADPFCMYLQKYIPDGYRRN